MSDHSHTPQPPESRNTGARGADLPVPLSGARVSHEKALEAAWKALELTPHRKIGMGPSLLNARFEMLRFQYRTTNGVVSGGCLAVNWVEMPVVPVNFQGLTDAERTWAKIAGGAMMRALGFRCQEEE